MGKPREGTLWMLVLIAGIAGGVGGGVGLIVEDAGGSDSAQSWATGLTVFWLIFVLQMLYLLDRRTRP